MKRIASTVALSLTLMGMGSFAMAQSSAPMAPDKAAPMAPDNSANSAAMAPDTMSAPPEAAAPMAADQSSSRSDRKLTREIHRSVERDHQLSMLARHVKITTADGSVTLTGPVKTEAEKDAIASKAEKYAGAGKVDNQLQVEAQN